MMLYTIKKLEGVVILKKDLKIMHINDNFLGECGKIFPKYKFNINHPKSKIYGKTMEMEKSSSL